jgi:hypothetical protein
MSDPKPIMEQLTGTATDASDGVQSMKANVQNTLADFSNKGVTGVTSEFAESNGLVAKFAFIIFVLIIFLFLFKLGVQALGYFLSPSKNPFIVYGKLEGGTSVTISQNPTNTNAIPIYRSNNEFSGAEFTWSVWLYLNLSPATAETADKYNTIFVKGASAPNAKGIHTTNGPGLYAQCNTNGVGNLKFVFDDIGSKQNEIKVDNIPLQKWVHVAFRLKNTVLDVYINGSINNRYQLRSAPKQNYYDINIGANGGYSGYLSNLRYYDHALNVFDINNIVMFGPNTANSSLSSDYQSANGDYSYLSTKWYNMK